MIGAQARQGAVEVRDGVGLQRGDGVLLEERETVVVADLLAGIEQRLHHRQGPREHGHRLPRVAHPLELRPAPRILVVVGREAEPAAAAAERLLVPVQIAHEAVGVGLALREVVQQVVQFPGIGGGKAGIVQPGLLALGEEVQRPRVFFPECRQNLRPEILRDLIGHVAAESVHAALQPEVHALPHLGAHLGAAVVELGDVGPVVFDDRISLCVTNIPFRGLLRHPRMVRRGVVGHPVQDDLEPLRVCRGEEVVEVGERAEFRVDVAVVPDGVIGAQGALAALLPDGIGRHDPEDVHAQLLQQGQVAFRRGESAFRRELADVEFIDEPVARPGVGDVLLRGPLRAGDRQHAQGQYRKQSFHLVCHWAKTAEA